jgi:Bacterial extracellular solute-binding proteins, family 5 Middle
MTVRFNLSEPLVPLLSALTDRSGMMVSPKAARALGDRFGTRPVCAGPYRFVERVAQGRIALEKFPDYCGPPAGALARPDRCPPRAAQHRRAPAGAVESHRGRRVVAEASLSFLGLGQQPPAPSWGSMLNAAQRYLGQAPWMAIYPGLMIFAVVVALNVLGDALRDALDPRGAGP